MKEKINKLEGHIEGLLDCFIALKIKYSFLHPMLFEENVCKIFGAGNKAYGYETIKYALFYDCIQDIVKLSFDKDTRTPSLNNIIESLNKNATIRLLKNNFSEPTYIKNLEQEDLARIQSNEKSIKEKTFETNVKTLLNKWEDYNSEAYVQGFKTIRNKLKAHLELKLVDGEYKQIDVSNQNLKWDDPSRAITAIQEIISILNILIRNSHYAFEMLDDQLKDKVKEFWK